MDETRYKDAGEADYALLAEVRNKWFPEFFDARIRILLDLRKKTHGGGIVLGRIYKTNDLIKHLTLSEAEASGTDLILFLDNVCWNDAGISQDDKIRLMRHELRHVVKTEGKNPWSIIAHDIEDFEVEVELNKDDIGWRRRMGTLTLTIYQQREEAEKEAKKLAKGGRRRRGAGVAKLL